MEGIDRDALRPLASKYIGWKTPEEALVRQVGDAVLRRVIARAEAGQFAARSWACWHYRLDLARIGHVPALAVRRAA